MPNAKVVFLHGLPRQVVDVIHPYTPAGSTTQIVDGKTPEAEQLAAVADADFLMVYRARLNERVLRAATRIRLVQLLFAGYDNMKRVWDGEPPLAIARDFDVAA
jgi:phosphoglycerate dehydrogenase-like enzyme